jgi:hypothetical protein
MPIGVSKLNSIAKYSAPSASRTAITITAAGNAQLDTAQYKFGTASYLGDGSGDYVTCATTTDAFNFGTGNFTIEFWVRLNGNNVTQVPIAGRFSGSIYGGQWWAELTPSNGMYWGVVNTAATQYYPGDGTAANPFSTATWYHVALVKNGSSIQMYRNGSAYGSAVTVTGSFGYTGDIWAGALGPGGYSLNGWIDEFRVSKIARYTTTFTPSTTAFTNDADTTMLLHFDGADASTTFTDDNA